eukprot:c32112_g1_i1.p1 GENE.c32112_g1_i1~~c32112_g1_i1.p1  ORF type:complete len:684 (+),score=137.55 c32112_g1_i1:1-2052(+)
MGAFANFSMAKVLFGLVCALACVSSSAHGSDVDHDCGYANREKHSTLMVEDLGPHVTSYDPHQKAVAANLLGKRLDLKIKLMYIGGHCEQVGQVIAQKTTSCTTQQHVCQAEDILTPEKETYVKTQVLPRAVAFWEKTLGVDDMGPLRVTAHTCCAQPVPAVNFGVPSDPSNFVLFVTFLPTTGSTLATAGACVLDSRTRRPISGVANFGVNKIVKNGQGQFDSNRDFITAVHELAHALGFGSHHYQNFLRRTPNGLENYDRVTVQSQERGGLVTRMVTPNVVAYVRKLFNCPQMAGAELEDFESDSRGVGSHWEQRVHRGEVMAPTVQANTVISPLTVALFKDMGWYHVNDHPLQEQSHGRGLGCSFAHDRCNTWPSPLFCNSQRCAPGYRQCSADRRAKAFCEMATFTEPLPERFRYFSDPRIGGNDQYGDFCPTINAFSNGQCSDTTQRNTPERGEMYGPNSFCYESTVSKTRSMTTYSDDCGAPVIHSCHVTQCLRNAQSQKTVRVWFAEGKDAWVECPRQGGKVDVYEALKGRLNPNCRDDPNWRIRAVGLSDCKSFQGVCMRYNDIGQMAACPVTCGLCAEWKGTVDCPAADSFCSEEMMNANKLAFPNLAADNSNGVGLGLIIGGCIVGAILIVAVIVTLRKRLRRNGQLTGSRVVLDVPNQATEYTRAPAATDKV